MVTPDEAIDAIRGTGGAVPGHRALHAKGTMYRGTFVATPEAKALSRAAHLDGSPVPTLVRFSNGAGNPRQRDDLPHIRGMAVKFTLPDGSTTDISCQTARLFTSSTPDEFVELMRAAKPGPAALVNVPKFIATHPDLRKSGRANAVVAKVPASYATVEYHALHAFRFVDGAGGSRFVRYHLIPAAGDQFLPLRKVRSAGAEFLTEELAERLAQGPVEFDLVVQIAGPDDSTIDPSAPWDDDTTTTIGTLRITGLDTEREHDGDIVVFDPMRVTDGIEPSDDPILHFRTIAYSASVKLRTGVDRGAEAPHLG